MHAVTSRRRKQGRRWGCPWARCRSARQMPHFMRPTFYVRFAVYDDSNKLGLANKPNGSYFGDNCIPFPTLWCVTCNCIRLTVAMSFLPDSFCAVTDTEAPSCSPLCPHAPHAVAAYCMFAGLMMRCVLFLHVQWQRRRCFQGITSSPAENGGLLCACGVWAEAP